jgi:predicted ATPase with chaperone activity
VDGDWEFWGSNLRLTFDFFFQESNVDLTPNFKLGLSARAFNRVLKIARTIADLEGRPDVQVDHISEAILYRNLDRGSQIK